jgi:hypothetical protein
MMRPFLLAAMAFLFPVAAQASDGSHYSSDQGAISGRSPHRTHRPLVQVSNCAKATPNLPAGKLPVFGRDPAPRTDCAPRTMGAAGAASAAARSGS